MKHLTLTCLQFVLPAISVGINDYSKPDGSGYKKPVLHSWAYLLHLINIVLWQKASCLLSDVPLFMQRNKVLNLTPNKLATLFSVIPFRTMFINFICVLTSLLLVHIILISENKRNILYNSNIYTFHLHSI
jgi:hypothetical protein